VATNMAQRPGTRENRSRCACAGLPCSLEKLGCGMRVAHLQYSQSAIPRSSRPSWAPMSVPAAARPIADAALTKAGTQGAACASRTSSSLAWATTGQPESRRRLPTTVCDGRPWVTRSACSCSPHRANVAR